MKLNFLPSSESDRRYLSDHLDEFLKSAEFFNKEISAVQLSAAQPVYHLELAQLYSHLPLQQAKTDVRRYLLACRDEVVASVDLTGDETDELKILSVDFGPKVEGIVAAISLAESISNQSDAQARILDVPALAISFLWLHGTSDAFVKAFEIGEQFLKDKVYDEKDFLRILLPMTEEIKSSEPSLGGEFEDFEWISVREIAEKLGLSRPTMLSVLPKNLDEAHSWDTLQFDYEFDTVRLIWASVGLEETPLVPDVAHSLVQARSYVWTSPPMFFSNELLRSSPATMSKALTALSDVLKTRYRHDETQQCEIKVIVEDKKLLTRQFRYRGAVSTVNDWIQFVTMAAEQL